MVTAITTNLNALAKTKLVEFAKLLSSFRRVFSSQDVILWLVPRGVFHLFGAERLPFAPFQQRNSRLPDWPRFNSIEARFTQSVQKFGRDNDESAGLRNWRHKRASAFKLQVARLGPRRHAVEEHVAVVAPRRFRSSQAI